MSGGLHQNRPNRVDMEGLPMLLLLLTRLINLGMPVSNHAVPVTLVRLFLASRPLRNCQGVLRISQSVQTVIGKSPYGIKHEFGLIEVAGDRGA